MRLNQCQNFHDFRRMARQRLPGPIFNYIDGAADDETTYRRNTEAFEACDLVPDVLRGTHVLKALALGAKAVGLGRYYLFPLAAAGRPGVERALEQMRVEIERAMKLMGCRTVAQLQRRHLRFR